jgi:hypothetical protein
MGRKGKFRPPGKRERAEAAASAADSGTSTENPYVSRGGLKLRRALDAFESGEFGLDVSGLDVSGLWCADLGCSTGGFTDCLLQAGAARVYSVDTAYGELAWKVRTDERVVVMERTNAVHAEVPQEVIERGGVDLVVIDLGWTAQAKAIPAALRWVRPRRGPGASPGLAPSGVLQCRSAYSGVVRKRESPMELAPMALVRRTGRALGRAGSSR